jgi:hypothetical protein
MPNYWIISDGGMLALINALRDPAHANYLNSLTLRLYQNDFTPVHGTTTPTFIEATYSGYVAQPANNWGAPATNTAPPDADTTDALHTFAHNGGAVGNTIYGVYLTDSGGNWIFAQRTNVTPPPVLDAATKTYQFTPRLTGAIYSAYP